MGTPSRISNWLRRFSVAGCMALLCACGGGTGGTTSTPAPPAPAPSPSPSQPTAPAPTPGTALPPPAPVASQFNTTEFRRSDGPGLHNAPFVWAAGHSGSGVTIAVVDNGVDAANPEFAGRISSLSRDMHTSGRQAASADDHGTNVALTAAAARNSTGMLGMAYEATIMALRTDTPGTCTGDNPSDPNSECSFPSNLISDAVTYAANNGAKVINISLGGDAAGLQLRNAVADAVNRGLLVVVSAGNDSATDPDGFARELVTAGAGGVIVVGSIDEDGKVSDFSNKAGVTRDSVLMALGGGVCCVYKDGQILVENNYVYLFQGTSYAAPQVSGAAALLADAFPNLTGRQIAELLLKNAHDAGTVGTDAVFGRGILDIAAAFAPHGATTLAGGTIAVPLDQNLGTGSTAMGDALGAVSMPAMVLDSYQRAYQVDLGTALRGAQSMPRLWQALSGRQRNLSLGLASASLAFQVDSAGRDTELSRMAPLHSRAGDADRAQVRSARIVTEFAPGAQFAFGYRQEAGGIVAELQGQDRPGFMLAPSASNDEGFFRDNDIAIALRHRLGPWGVTLSGERGTVGAGSQIQQATALNTADAVSGAGAALDRRFGAVQAALGLSLMAEESTVLGARFHDAFGVAGADTLFIDAALRAELAPGWSLGGQLRQGRTDVRGSGPVTPGSHLASRAWSFDVERRGVFAGDDALAIRIAQPLRVEGGSLDLKLPVAYSYETLQPTYDVRSLALTPQGRELIAEIAWRGRLFAGHAAAAVFYRRDPGHYEALPDDRGVALRWSRGF